jgi:hypothetical protein
MQVPTALSIVIVQCALLAQAFQDADYEMLVDDEVMDWADIATPEEPPEKTQELRATQAIISAQMPVTSSRSDALVLAAAGYWVHLLCSLAVFRRIYI